MKFNERDLAWAVDEGIISEEQRGALAAALRRRAEERGAFTFANLLYYLGGLIVIASLTIYVGLNWQSLGGLGHLLVALAYGLAFLAAGHVLWNRPGLRIPGGILITASVCVLPLFIYSLHELLGWAGSASPGDYRDFYIWIKGGWASMELGTAAGALLALRRYRFPFLTMPLAFALWYLSMDITPILFGEGYTRQQLSHASMLVGAAMLAVAYGVDQRTREDFSFWGYLFGLMAFWGGLTSLHSDSELGKFLYCMINVGLMLLAVLLQRRVFLAFGGVGLSIYLGHLAYDVFKDTIAFTFILSGIGLLVILAGLLYHRNARRLNDWVGRRMPRALRPFLPRYRR